MTRHNLIKVILLIALVFIPVAGASAQEDKVADRQRTDVRQPAGQPQDARGNMLRQLGLSREQIQQIRRMNAERRSMMDEAQRRFREANMALDAAIYADEVNEANVEARLKDVQLAHAEIQRLRFMNELAVRRILTPEQLVRFREMRRRFEEARENFQQRRPFNRDRHMERPQNGTDDVKTPAEGHRPARPFARPAEQGPDRPRQSGP